MSEHDAKRDPARNTRLAREIQPQTDLWPGIARRIEFQNEIAREIEPSRDLWPGIRRRLEGSEPVRAPDSRVSWIGWTGWAVAAAALVLAFQLPTTVPERESRLALPGELAMPFEQANLARGEARARLHRVLAEDGSISPETRALVERNLETIDRALREIQHALASDPGNASLYRLLHATYRQEAELVAQMTRRGRAGGGSL